MKDSIKKDQEHLDKLNSVDVDGMKKTDKKARAAADKTINWNYYTGSKFFGDTAKDMASQGFKMGLRQSVGMILAEIWFELKDRIPQIIAKCKNNFELGIFFDEVKKSFNNIWEKIKIRFKELLNEFKNGVISGIISSMTTTLWNAFQTIGGNTIKIIRESWANLCKIVKLIFFNPKKLQWGDLVRKIIRILGTTAAVSVSTLLHNVLMNAMISIPSYVSGTLSAFVSALVSGVLTVGLSYFLDYSETMQKVWQVLNQLKSKYEKILEFYRETNKELDRYLTELAKTEFNMSPAELEQFAHDLQTANDEYQRQIILTQETSRRNIELPFQPGNIDSIRQWSTNLQAKT